MKRVLLPVLAFLLITSCKKENATSDPTIPANGWKLGSTEYTTFYGFRFTDPSDGSMNLSAVDRNPTEPNPNSLLLHFTQTPTAGTYKVVAFPTIGSQAANEVLVQAGSTSDVYISTGAGTINVTVTVSGGKITAVVPEIPVKNAAGTESKLSGTLKES